jgi:molybdenum cofactor cytidylyltransferase
MTIGLIVLAAGSSSRMGTAKQLLVYDGKTLLRRAAESGINSGCAPVVVVLGHDEQRMRAEIENLPVTIAVNPNWEEGMGTSIHVGIQELQNTPTVEAAVLTLCDQPLVDASLIRKLLDSYQTGKFPIVAAKYGGALGVPALFARNYFSELQRLAPGAGAKQLLAEHVNDVAAVPLDAAAVDVDTPADFKRLVGDDNKR